MSQQTEEQTINVGVIGAGGRMGRMLIEAVQDNPQTTLNAAIERQGSSLVGADAGEVAAIGRLEVQIVDDLKAVINDIDVLIDFSLPDATEQNMQICAANKVAMVIGTTGFNEQQEQVLKEASKQIAIVYAGNYSTGVNLSLKLLAMAAKAFGNDADVEVIEAQITVCNFKLCPSIPSRKFAFLASGKLFENLEFSPLETRHKFPKWFNADSSHLTLLSMGCCGYQCSIEFRNSN